MSKTKTGGELPPGAPTLKPGQVLWLTRAGGMPDRIKGGRERCRNCGELADGNTECPAYHENGVYRYCPHCKLECLLDAEFPPCEGWPLGFRIDMTGERRRYPIVSPSLRVDPASRTFNPDAGILEKGKDLHEQPRDT